ncbi:MAG: reverse transcriptase domain-containing protein [Candidatus Peribacteraceae bacterium]|nr:reverse transcriptase domain-containing protein [Candidatus Peribacteraceae bacterium]
MSIDLSLPALWHCWQRFKRGKKRTTELEHFRFYLEKNLTELNRELCDGTYEHGAYRSFCVNDTKRREIAVASIRDRFVHRLLYEHLVNIYDKTFIHDIWSCREGKGLLAAIERAQEFLARNRNGFFWRGDVRKFFDSVDHATLVRILGKRITDGTTMRLLKKVIDSYATNEAVGSDERERERERVLPNLRAGSPLAT